MHRYTTRQKLGGATAEELVRSIPIQIDGPVWLQPLVAYISYSYSVRFQSALHLCQPLLQQVSLRSSPKRSNANRAQTPCQTAPLVFGRKCKAETKQDGASER